MDLKGLAAIAGVFGSFCFVTFWFFQGILRWRETGQQTRIMTDLIARIGSGAEAAQVLESSAARSVFDKLVDRRTIVLQRILRAVQSGILLVFLGGALFTLRPRFTGEEELAMMVLATLALSLGLAFLLAAGVSFGLSRRWKLIDES